MIVGHDPLEQRISGLARIGLSISIVFALLPPLGYGLIAVGSVKTEMAVSGRIRADTIGQSIAARPRLWSFEQERFNDLLRRLAQPGESLELIDSAGISVATTQIAIPAPALEISIPIHASGDLAAHLVVRQETGSLILGGMIALAMGLGLGCGLFLAMRAWPLGALQRAIAELKAADDSKSLLLSAVGHDLRQPLQSLSLFAAVISASDLAPTPRRAAEMLNESLIRLGTMLDEIIAIARIDVGAIEESKGPVALEPLLEHLVQEMAAQAESKGLRLRHVSTHAVTFSDPSLLTTIVRNLLSNAIRYTEQGGILLGCRRQGPMWQICVYDTGIGIEHDKQGRVFEEFFQVGNPERDRTKGLGLGLAIVIRLARLLHHRISLRSTLGRGSVFAVSVPMVPSLKANDQVSL
ncbi:sensor histidine kinase [Magnetospirillum molischianum]|uniref:histidine kinase n=1 Tax=Magnetospirillum molischianum DSM 120 TaxID=1150626 RepID=H8FP94_MAGML|nr:HAMP domain-containing sensor histidine kinase [Magnetospirillum molischianum]CCG40182.1 Putative two-component sensor Histidine kinase, classical system [Magnetospirillum molischianum DSM 120]